MKNLSIIPFLFLALLSLTFTACDDDEGSPPEQEVITTVRLTFLENGNTTFFTVADPDGDGGNAPVADTLKLKAGVEYAFNVAFLDESSGTAENLTPEIITEAVDHLVCYELMGGFSVSVTVADQDANGDPLGQAGSLTVTGTGDGAFKVILKHEPDKAATAPCTTGETDVEVIFPMVVE